MPGSLPTAPFLSPAYTRSVDSLEAVTEVTSHASPQANGVGLHRDVQGNLLADVLVAQSAQRLNHGKRRLRKHRLRPQGPVLTIRQQPTIARYIAQELLPRVSGYVLPDGSAIARGL